MGNVIVKYHAVKEIFSVTMVSVNFGLDKEDIFWESKNKLVRAMLNLNIFIKV
jgi:hypothetical protein